MNHSKELLSVPLAKLVPSALNVRRHAAGQVEELAALIASQGLLHNLVVTEQVVASGRGQGRARQGFAVAAGERRRRALLLLQQRGQLPADHEVLCELVAPERALELSLAENSGREAMHPADEFEAFQGLVAEGKGIEDVAARFGVSPLTVQRRLKLAALSPKLLALYRDDGINLDQLMALALTDEHAVQERTWFDAHPWDRSPAALRRRLTAGEVEAAGNGLVRFVGLDAYEAAGGVVRRDLFDDEQARFLADPALLEKLAAQKLEALAADIRQEGWAWVETRVLFDATAMHQFASCAYQLREPTAAEQAELDALTQRSQELERQGQALADNDGWRADEAEMIDLEEQDIEARRTAIQHALRTWSPHAMRHAGAIVTISRQGDVEVIRGLVREADRKALAQATSPEGCAEQSAAAGDGDGGDGGGSAGGSGAAAKPTHAAYSEALSKRLAAHRTMALQAMLVQNSAVTLAALAHVLVLRVFGADYPRTSTAMRVCVQTAGYALEAVADDLPSSSACKAIRLHKQTWLARLPAQQADWLPWLIGLPQAELIELLVLCSALTVNGLPATGASANVDALVAAVGLDMADWWVPTAESYLKHVSKAQIVQALHEAGPELAGGGVEAMKKDALVTAAAQRLAGMRWIPQTWRKPAV